MTDEAHQLIDLLKQSLEDGSLCKVVLSKPGRGHTQIPPRVDVRPVQVREQQLWQFTHHANNQDFHRNLSSADAISELSSQVGTSYRDCTITLPQAEWSARFSKRGRCVLKQRRIQATAGPASHNREREYLIADDQPVPFLIATGVMTAEGKVRSKHFRKFRQINRYVEFIRDVVAGLPEGRLRIVDFGSGKSYLTFAVHYYLTQVLHRSVQITGLDRRSDVVDACRKVAADLNLTGIEFVTGDIADYVPDAHVHLAISLHACDTATDDAIAAAVNWQTDVILAVPCCQHELAASCSRTAQPVLSQHGILHERFSELATDATRAALLSCVGYETSVLEFIDLEHTARNMLIRAVRQKCPDVSTNQKYRTRLTNFMNDFSLPPLQLQRKLEESGLLPAIDLVNPPKNS